MIFENLDTYLATFIADMRDRVESTFEPLYDPGRTPLSPEVLDLVRCPMSPYPAQAVTSEAIARAFGTGRVVIVNGEQGVGKTPIGPWAILTLQKQRLGRPMRVVLTCPNQLTRKWKRHCEQIIPGCRATIIRSWRDVLRIRGESYEVVKTIKHANGSISTQVSKRWRKPDRTEILILPRDRGKLGYAWRAGPVPSTKGLIVTSMHSGAKSFVKQHVYRCPKCGVVIKDDAGKEVAIDHFTTKAGRLSQKRICQHKRSIKQGTCQSLRDQHLAAKRPALVCGEPLHQAYNGKPSRWADKHLPLPGVSPRRIAPCTLLKRFGARFDLYIADEIHELRGGDSLQGQMLADLVGVSDRQMLLTGTLIGGYATNLLYILWRTISPRMVEAGITHDPAGEDQYVATYGVLRQETRYTAENNWQDHEDLILGRGKAKKSKRTKAMPGISPLAFVHFLLDRTVFLRLKEMHEHLPQFDEHVHTIPLDKDQDDALAKMQKDFDEHRRTHRPCRAWSGAQAAFLRWPDKPYVAPYWVMDKDDEGNPIRAFYVPSLPQRERPKDRRIRRLITRNKLRGRKTWVFTELTGQNNEPEWDIMDDLAAYLKRYGIRAAVLRAEAQGGPKPEDREAWIEKIAPQVDCVISSPILVQTGLDLFDFPSIIFAYCGYNTYVLRQASRRAWRLGQNNFCEVDYLVYGGPHVMSQAGAFTAAVDVNGSLIDEETGDDERWNMVMRVRKLVALAEDPAASPGEMVNALTAAERIISEYGITEAEIRGKDPDKVAVQVAVPSGPTRVLRACSRSVQAAALSLMATKLEASLAIEGDFSSEGLTAMSGGEDIATQLARFIDGKLDDLEPASTAFERYRKRLQEVMPELGKAMREETQCRNKSNSPSATDSEASTSAPSAPAGATSGAAGGIGHASSTAGKPGASAAPTTSSAPSTTSGAPNGSSPSSISASRGPASSTGSTPTPSQSNGSIRNSNESRTSQPPKSDGDRASFSLIKSLGIAPAPVNRSGAEIFERPSQVTAQEPDNIRDRKQQRLAALIGALNLPLIESDGDRHRIGDHWFHLVAKRRETVRERNFTATAADCPEAWIAFVEPLDQLGPTESDVEITVGGVVYRVSTIPVADYMNGERTPGGLPEIART